MCTTCGCSASNEVIYTDPNTGVRQVVPAAGAHTHAHGPHEHAHDHHHPHDHSHAHDHPHPHEHSHPPGHRVTQPTLTSAAAHGRTVALEQEILAKNQLLAERNRGWLAGREVLAINLMSSPGAGKTSILERTIRDLRMSVPMCVLEGDQATTNDAERIQSAGSPVVQINTGTGCHLDADMVARGLRQLDPPRGAMVLIENVGNLVCPALFDVGEQARVAVWSVTEGEDKPAKYPHMFRTCELILLNKIDLLPYVRFDADRCMALARQVNPNARLFPVSAETGEGMEAWYAWLRHQIAAAQCRRGLSVIGERAE